MRLESNNNSASKGDEVNHQTIDDDSDESVKDEVEEGEVFSQASPHDLNRKNTATANLRDSALRKGEWFVKDKVEIVGMMRTNGRPLNDRSSIYVCYKHLNHGA